MEQAAFFEGVRRSLDLAACQLFAPFEQIHAEMAEDPSLDVSDFHASFLAHANEFAAFCPTACAGAVREISVVPEVRGTPTKALASELRSQAFDRLDALFLEAFQLLRDSNANVDAAISSIQNANILGSALEGAFVGGVIGSAFKGTTTGTLLGAYVSVDHETTIANRQVSNALRASLEARKAAEAKLREWLEWVPEMPEPLIDWAGARAFGSTVDFGLQKACVAAVQSDLKHRVRRAVEACDAIDNHRANIIEQEQKEERDRLARKQEDERQREEEEKFTQCRKCKSVVRKESSICPYCGKTSWGCASSALAVGAPVLLCGIAWAVSEDEKDWMAITTCVLFGLVAIAFGVSTIVQRLRWKPSSGGAKGATESRTIEVTRNFEAQLVQGRVNANRPAPQGQTEGESLCPKCGKPLGQGVSRCWAAGCDYVVSCPVSGSSAN